MPRNEAKPLSEVEARYQAKVSGTLALTAEYRDVKVDYTKRDGSNGSVTGRVQFFNGQVGMDTGSVTIADVERGNRTINLHRIIRIE